MTLWKRYILRGQHRYGQRYRVVGLIGMSLEYNPPFWKYVVRRHLEVAS